MEETPYSQMMFISLRSQWMDRISYLYPVLKKKKKDLKYFNWSSVNLCVQKQGWDDPYFLVTCKYQELELEEILQLIYLIQTSHLKKKEVLAEGDLQGERWVGLSPQE